MAEPTGHCPYVGLKQNRAIRFAAPTPEHRCYVAGEPIEIPVDQTHYCLAAGHVHCPLYTGSGLASMSGDLVVDSYAAAAPPPGVRGWFGSLAPRDRSVYLLMLALLLLIAMVALAVALGSLPFWRTGGTTGSATPNIPATATQQLAAIATAPPTAPPSTPTDLPTSAPLVLPTATATQALIIAPTQQASSVPTIAATSIAATQGSTALPLASSTPLLPSATAVSLSATAAGANATVVPPSATAIPASATPMPPSATPVPASATPVPASPAPAVTRSTARVTLYFADASGSVFVPSERTITVENGQLADAAIRALIAGPSNGLQRLIPADTQLLGLSIADGTATANFSRWPSSNSERGLRSIVQTLVRLPNIERVQFQINGQNSGIGNSEPVRWTPLNLLNPQNLPVDVRQAAFLPLYFPASSGSYDVQIIRLVPPTKDTAAATVRALLEGPGSYNGVVQQVLPAGTTLRGVRLANGTLAVDLSQAFAGAANRDAAVRTLVESLTTLPTVQRVQVLVEGRSLGEWWGGKYGQVFSRPTINGA